MLTLSPPLNTVHVEPARGRSETVDRLRTPEIVADAAVRVLELLPERTGEVLIDALVLREAGVIDLTPYGGGDDPELGFFVDVRV